MIDSQSMAIKGKINRSVGVELLLDGDVLYTYGNDGISPSVGIVSYSLTGSNVLDFCPSYGAAGTSIAQDSHSLYSLYSYAGQNLIVRTIPS